MSLQEVPVMFAAVAVVGQVPLPAGVLRYTLYQLAPLTEFQEMLTGIEVFTEFKDGGLRMIFTLWVEALTDPLWLETFPAAS